MSDSGNTGVHVLTGVEEAGRVAVCVPVPTETKAILGPSLTIRSVLPFPGRATEVLALAVAEMLCVMDVQVKGVGADIISP